jgi:hypothetical protein
MKSLFLSLCLFLSIGVFAQEDSTSQYANSNITITIPVKAVVLYAAYLSESPNWVDRKAPDYFQTIIGSGTQPDSLITVVIKAHQLSTFAIRLTGERYGVSSAVNRSIFNNSPSIPGYTALFTQVVNKANGVTSEKGAAMYVRDKYNAFSATMTNLYNEYYNKGLDWIRN